MTLLKACAALVVVFAAFSSHPVSAQKRRAASTKTETKTYYSCPMHPDVVSAKKGRCPKCGMDLRPQRVSARKEIVAVPTDTDEAPKTESSSFSSSKIPNARVLDQNGKQLNFYTDLIKGKTVAIDFVFTTCTAICPSLTATFRKVQQEAHARGVDVQLISVTVDPTVDTPERLDRR